MSAPLLHAGALRVFADALRSGWLTAALGGLLAGSLAHATAVGATGAPPEERSDASDEGEVVVLLHGLGRSARAMRPLERSLADAGYRVHNLDYPSTRAPDAILAHLEDALGACCAGPQRVHFVTHSLGGIVLRAFLAEREFPQLGRAVMLAPPNRGSEYVDIAGDWTIFRGLLGPTASQLGTDPDSLPNRLPAPDFEFAVIAGTGGLNWIGDAVMEGANDGTVSVASTRLVGMSDFIVVDASHTFIMRNDEVKRQVLRFLREGRFAQEGI